MEDDTCATTYAKNKIIYWQFITSKFIHFFENPKLSHPQSRHTKNTMRTNCTQRFIPIFFSDQTRHLPGLNERHSTRKLSQFPQRILLWQSPRPLASAIIVHFNNDIGLGEKNSTERRTRKGKGESFPSFHYLELSKIRYRGARLAIQWICNGARIRPFRGTCSSVASLAARRKSQR